MEMTVSCRQDVFIPSLECLDPEGSCEQTSILSQPPQSSARFPLPAPRLRCRPNGQPVLA